jgi:predicted nucleic acid-binding protein
VFLLDTSTLIELEAELSDSKIGKVRAFLGRHKSQPLACTTVTVGELAAGSDEASIRFFLRKLRKLPLSEAVAYQAAVLDQQLSSMGRRLGENDTWIAATALLYSATLVYLDGDFERVPSLKRQRL